LTAETLKGDRQVYFTMVELAGNSAYDLLNSRKPVSILEDSSGVTQLVGAEEHRVQGRAEVTDLIERASSHRRTAPTLKNGASSRSHGICRVRIRDPAAGTEGLLYLVDLAGSEAARDVAAHGADRMRETRDINMSLSVLKDCIRGKAMADALKRESRDGPRARQEKPHVPYRRSALTKVLKHVFDPVGSQVCKTVVIACVNPSLGDVGPSKNTLRYAEMLRVVLPKVEDNSGVAPVFQTVVDKATNSMARTSSRDLGQHDIDVPFRKRIRPGMIIRWNPTLGSRSSVGLAEDAVKLAAVLSPANTTSVIMGISPGNRLCGSEHVGATSGDCQAAYLCALLTPSQVENAYELNLWRQTVVGVNEMEQEVILEYDTRTRYYYIST
jgi:kinesin family protein 2/24